MHIPRGRKRQCKHRGDISGGAFRLSPKHTMCVRKRRQGQDESPVLTLPFYSRPQVVDVTPPGVRIETEDEQVSEDKLKLLFSPSPGKMRFAVKPQLVPRLFSLFFPSAGYPFEFAADFVRNHNLFEPEVWIRPGVFTRLLYGHHVRL